MGRKNIFDILKSNYDVVHEANKILKLFELPQIIYEKADLIPQKEVYTIESLFDEELIMGWKQRGTFLSTKEIKQKLGVPRIFSEEHSIDDILNYLEYCQNIIYLVVFKFNILNRYNWYTNSSFSLLVENLQLLIDKLNCEILKIEEEEKVLIVPKNPEATAVAEISTEQTGIAILKYNHCSLKGDLDTKRSLLHQIALDYEPLLKNPIDNYKDYFDKTNALLNTLHIRHNNIDKDDNKNIVLDITDEELEKWYDELYQLMLFCILIKDNVKRKNCVSQFLKKIRSNK